MKNRLAATGPTLARALTLLAMIVPGLVHANWTATGRFQYTDRLYNLSGFTGTLARPVREADVQIYDVNTLSVLASGATNANGDFNIAVTDSTTRTVGVRVLASTAQTAILNFSVIDDVNGNAVFSYHDSTKDVTGHGPSTNQNFGIQTMPAAIGSVASTDWSSQIFNALDLCIYTADWIASVDGARPSQPLTVGWNPNSGSTSSSYSGGSNRLNLADDDGYDDANILHEIGHWVEDEYGRSRNIGGSHNSSDDGQDPRLAWSEGFATVVSGATLNFHGLPFPNVYSDRDSFGASGGGGFSYDFETTTTGGSTQERAVTSAIYDLIDDNNSADGSVGSDDDSLGGLDGSVWAVLEEMRVRQLPYTSLEDFWDIWRSLALGSESAIQAAFAVHSIDFLADSSEPDNLRSAAKTLTGSYVKHTFYRNGAEPGGDEDWFQFSATVGTYYRVQVNGAANQIFGRSDPELYLLSTDGKTVLAHNDDPLDTSLNADTSNHDMIETVPEILWRAPATGTYYVYCRHSAKQVNLGGRYGTYQIRIVTVGSPSPTISTVAAQRMRPGQVYRALLTGSEMAVNAVVTTSSGDVTVPNTRWIAPNAIVATLAVAAGATTGSFSVTVTNPGAGSAVKSSAITIDAAAAPPVILSEIQVGSDQAEVRNLGTVAATLTGWQIIGRTTSTTQQTFTFPAFSLPAGGTVRISENFGTNTATELYDLSNAFNWAWDYSTVGDASLLDDAGRNVDYLRWIESYTQSQYAPLGTGAAWMQPEMLSPTSGLNVSRSADTNTLRSSIGVSAANPTMPTGAAGRDNAVDAPEDNDTPRRAPLISAQGTLSNLAISPRPGATPDNDWFGIPMPSGATLNVTALFTHAAGNLNLEIYAPGEETTPLLTANTTTNDESISFVTANGSGVYRLRIFGVSSATNSYTLQVASPPPDYFTEKFDAGHSPDLANQTLTFFPDTSPSHYYVCRTPTSVFPVDPAGGTVWALSNDGAATVPLGGATVLLHGVSYGTIRINANGNLTFAAADATSSETLDLHFNQPRISGWFDDLNPSMGGTVSSRILSDRVVVTFEQIPENGLPSNTVSFQIELRTDGSGIIQITHLDVLAGDGIVGISAGPGATPGDYATSDLSGYRGCLLEDWRTLFFGPGNPPGSEDLADFDSDGILTIWEYAFGLNPKVANTEGKPILDIIDILGEDNLTYTYNRPLKNTDYSYVVEFSTDLIDWDPLPDTLLGVTNFVESRRAAIPIAGEDTLFLRLKLTNP